MEVKIEVWDSPNSAGVVIDAVRCAKLALDNGIGGALYEPSSYFMKTPPAQYTDDVARAKTEEFIKGWAVGAKKPAAAPTNGNGREHGLNGKANGNGAKKPAKTTKAVTAKKK
jgi:hypothetical protein